MTTKPSTRTIVTHTLNLSLLVANRFMISTGHAIESKSKLNEQVSQGLHNFERIIIHCSSEVINVGELIYLLV